MIKKAQTSEPSGFAVAVVGAGPAGIYAARKLAGAGHEVTLINRDIKPGGLAEYGIFPDKHKMKGGLRKQFWKILDLPRVHYAGHIRVATDGDLTLPELRAMGFSAIVIAVGAQGTSLLGIPGEDGDGVLHAKDLVYWFNRLPPFASQDIHFGRRVAIIGIGNVMVDIAHWLVIHEDDIDTITVLVRRGPAERKYTKKEIGYVAATFDKDDLKAEIERVRPRLEAVGQDPDTLYKEMIQYCDKPLARESTAKLRFRFLSSPCAIELDASGKVTGVTTTDTQLVPKGDKLACKSLDTTQTLPTDTVIYAIGDRVDDSLGLPTGWSGYHAQDDNPYRARAEEPLPEVFLIGWARKASDGLVGKARKDAEIGCNTVEAYLKEDATPLDTPSDPARKLLALLIDRNVRVATASDARRLKDIEAARAEAEGVKEFKFRSDDAMFNALDAQPGS